MSNQAGPRLFSEEMEQTILGSFMANQNNYWEVADRLNSGAFYVKNHKAIFNIIRELCSDGKRPTPVLVSIRVKEDINGDPRAITGAMVHSFDKASDDGAYDVSGNVEEIIRLQGLRAMDQIQRELAKAVQVGSDPSALSDDLISRLSDISSLGVGLNKHSMKDIVKNVIDMAQDAAVNDGYGISTGLSSLDAQIGGFYPTDLILLGATPGGGKTALATQILIDAAKQGHQGVFNQIEMDNVAQMARYIAGMAGLTTRGIMNGSTNDELERLIGSAKSLEDLPFTLIDSPRQTIKQIEAVARSLKKRGKLSILVVDHVKLIDRNEKYRLNDIDRVYENARDLKALAKSLKIPIILLCQLTKFSAQKDDLRPNMGDFFGGGLEAHADLMMIIADRGQYMSENPPIKANAAKYAEHRAQIAMHQGIREVHVVKDRKAKVGSIIKLRWVGKETRFYDRDTSAAQTGMDFGGLPTPPQSDNMPTNDEVSQYL